MCFIKVSENILITSSDRKTIMQRNSGRLIISSEMINDFGKLRIEGDVLTYIMWYVAAIFIKYHDILNITKSNTEDILISLT